jgi:hypothetical protein
MLVTWVSEIVVVAAPKAAFMFAVFKLAVVEFNMK